MIIVFSKTIVFFLISLLYFYSLTGFGKLIDNTKSKSDKNFNFFELAIYGIILQLILGWSIYYTFGTNAYLNILILIFGLILYFFYKKNLNLINKKYLFFLLFLTFSVLIISKTHEDFNEYHLFSINEIFTNQLRIGVTNLNFKFFHSSLLAYNQSLFVLPYFNYVLIHLPIFFIYFLCLGYFFFICFKTNNDSERFYSLVIISLLLIKFNRMSEFGYDYISHFLLLIVFHKIFFFSNEKIELIKVFKIFTLCILIKPTSLLFSPIVLYLFYKNKFKFLINIYYSKIFILSFMLIILFSTSFSRTGCLFYPVNLTCFSSEKIFWSEKNKIKEHSELVSLWAKEYYNKDKSKYPKITDKNIYKKNFNWFKYWLEGHFFYKISEFLIILISIIVLIYIYISKERLNFKKKSQDYYVIFGLSFLSLLFWLNTVPHFRFGFSSIIIFIYLFFNNFLNLKINLHKKKIIQIILLSLVILHIKNINRINNEFQRNDFYKFNNFPFYNKIEIQNNEDLLKKRNFFHIEILE